MCKVSLELEVPVSKNPLDELTYLSSKSGQFVVANHIFNNPQPSTTRGELTVDDKVSCV